MLNAYLADRDEPCPRCGYNLRNLTGDTCPECGDALRLKVGLVEPRMFAYIASIIPWCIGLGASGFFVPLIVFDGPRNRWQQPFVWLFVVMLVLSVVALAFLLPGRTRFQRHANAIQTWFAIISWLVILGMFGLIVVLLPG